MKTFLVIASLAALATAEPPSSYGGGNRYQASEPQYGVPAAVGPAPNGGYGAPAPGGYESQGGYGAPAYVPQVFKHVYIHAAPDEPTYAENKVIRVPGGGDKHVNIIFVKAPSHSSSQQTEVILPEQPQQKTVVYVLVKKPENYNNVKVTAPQQTQPHKPEVFFIRYKNKEVAAPAYGPPPPAQAYGPVGVAPAPPQQEYGLPSGGYHQG
ncbi:uncharacterized protein LOC110844907 [Folsomia candida]|uniref:DUF243 domain-containing protein n=1 Tax=Folsomia candida TaxID=158441 RepID=A0A226EMR3_FOLCA|nr:uncharacterized protein LOC110844907 [Folsomia candida]OXA58975.1 hypothetical protein Fcan01_04292 [Folsomia candida]